MIKGLEEIANKGYAYILTQDEKLLLVKSKRAKNFFLPFSWDGKSFVYTVDSVVKQSSPDELTVEIVKEVNYLVKLLENVKVVYLVASYTLGDKACIGVFDSKEALEETVKHIPKTNYKVKELVLNEFKEFKDGSK